MTKRKLWNAIRKAGAEALDIEPELNSGGCGVFAEALATELSKYTQASIKLVRWDDNTHDSIDHFRQTNSTESDFLKALANYGLTHIIVQFTWDNQTYFADAEHIVKRWEDRVVEGDISIPEMQTLNSWVWPWNSMFSRSHIPAIHTAVQTAFTVLQ